MEFQLRSQKQFGDSSTVDIKTKETLYKTHLLNWAILNPDKSLWIESQRLARLHGHFSSVSKYKLFSQMGDTKSQEELLFGT